jgi:hypothetical protein
MLGWDISTALPIREMPKAIRLPRLQLTQEGNRQLAVRGVLKPPSSPKLGDLRH